jgi:3-oxoacyl-[acyl-carrier protein] reductase
MLEARRLDLTPRTALVTGGSRGVGRATATLLGRAGARVAINYRRDAAAAELVVQEIQEAGGEAIALTGDVSQPDKARGLVRDVVAAWGRLDILVNNAAVWNEDLAGEGRVDVWDRLYAVNQRGAFLVTDAAVPHLERSRGAIVFVSSTAGQRGGPRRGAYSATKGAVISYTKALAGELGPRGIRVNCVAPGWVETDMTAAVLADPEARARIVQTIPLGRVASPSDIAGPILFLVSDLARYVQGAVLSVNGGSVL